MLPTAQMRAQRELEPPSIDEGFSSVETIPFARACAAGAKAGVFVGAAAMAREGIDQALTGAHPAASHLLFDWRPDGDPGALRAEADRAASVLDAAGWWSDTDGQRASRRNR